MDTDYYKDSSLNIAAFILCHKGVLNSIERIADSDIYYFIFSSPDHDTCELLKSDFYAHGKVSAKEFLSRRKDLITQLNRVKELR